MGDNDAHNTKIGKAISEDVVFGNVLVGCVGIAVAAINSAQAILLDGLFNLTYFATVLIRIKYQKPKNGAFADPKNNQVEEKRLVKKKILSPFLLIALVAPTTISLAQEGGDAAAEMARKLQDPLAKIKALMTDNDVNFNTGVNEDETSYGFQLQPVYAIPFEDLGFNLVNRAVIPILGIAPGGQKSILGEPLPPGGSRTWGLSDSLLQFFFSPRTDNPWKWGVGPMVSLKTRTDSDLAGPGWGGGPVAVLVGDISENISTAFIGGHVWGNEDGFSTSMLQPMIFYNLPDAWNIHYNNMITYDWNADSSSNAWTVPLGLAVGKMFALKGGHGLEFFVGPYYNVVRPDGAADWNLKWGINWLLP